MGARRRADGAGTRGRQEREAPVGPVERQKVRIKDVAKAAGVSVGTVSHYLNGRFVSAERAERIRAAITELGFSSNLLARGMRMQRSPVIGLCVPYTTFSNFSTLVDAIEERVSEASFELMQVLSRQDPEKELARVRRLAAYKVGGLFLVPSLEPDAMLDHLASIGLPTVIVSRLLPDEDRFDQVAVDHRRQLQMVGRELVARGHRSILLVARFPKLVVTRLRIEGLEAAAEAGGAGVEVMACDGEADFAAQFAARMTGPGRPSAVILSNGVIAAWTIQALRRLGLAYPADLSLVTLDDPGWADLVEPPVTHIPQPSQEIARLAWEALARRMEDPSCLTRRVLLDTKVEWRE